MSAARQRADRVLVARGLVESRARAQAEIAAGHVLCGGHVLAKPGALIAPDAPLELVDALPYVSRGGLKLAHGLDVFGIEVAGKIALDLGASTGGFTDVLLRRGAACVYAVDVGHGQLHARLKGDARVTSLEGVDARALNAAAIGEAPHIVTADLSFIALEKALGPALALAAPGAALVALVKPQFEAGREHVAKGGIVRDAAARAAALGAVRAWLGTRPRWHVMGETASPIRGGDGNEEYLIAARKE